MNFKRQCADKATDTAELVQLIPVLFHHDTLVLVEHNAQPYVVMKPVVTAMGLDWRSQHVKFADKFGAVVVEITTTGADGKQYPMTCLPLRKLPAWLYSLNPGKLSATLRPKVIRYQNECDEVLWRHWTGNYLPQHTAEHVNLSRLQMEYERERTRVCLELAKCVELGLGRVLYDTYCRLSGRIGALIIPLENIAPALNQGKLVLEGGGK